MYIYTYKYIYIYINIHFADSKKSMLRSKAPVSSRSGGSLRGGASPIETEGSRSRRWC